MEHKIVNGCCVTCYEEFLMEVAHEKFIEEEERIDREDYEEMLLFFGDEDS